jgi:hypothetical protein
MVWRCDELGICLELAACACLMFLHPQTACLACLMPQRLCVFGICRIVVYVPSASMLTHGGYFEKRPDSRLYDTIISAQQVVKSVHDAHRDQLASLSAPDGQTGSLLDLAATALATDSNVSWSTPGRQAALPCPLRRHAYGASKPEQGHGCRADYLCSNARRALDMSTCAPCQLPA